METASVFDIFRGTTHDGPGSRSTVFFAGCPLRCRWCHNPEGMRPEPFVWWDPRPCIGCQLCVAACPIGAKRALPEGIVTDDAVCTRCGACVTACPTGAMVFAAKPWTLEALVDEVRRDKAYYDVSGGGVTASGGECMLQAPFVARFFAALHALGITTALDTCGLAAWEAFENVLPVTDAVLYDLKLLDPAAHKRFTGADNALILDNARRIAARIRQDPTHLQMWIRTPLIPGATATAENIAAISAFIQSELGGAVARWELCAFNNNCITKYDRLRLAWDYAQTQLLTQHEADALLAVAQASGFPAEALSVTGLLAQG